ncbi:hypothetical protein [Oryzobacter terrae]|uniref:hypothetical protein n=1 Tax=Oryzobacter terrae TaxID=1620385 RepID=UPI00366B3883
MSPSPLVAVVGASGGLGASTLALAVGRRLAARAGPPVVVADLAQCSGGLEVTAGVEHLPGRRWSDLREVRGRVPARRLVGTLPGEGGCHVLSGAPGAGGGASGVGGGVAGVGGGVAGVGGGASGVGGGVAVEAVVEVLASLDDGGVPCVLDLPVASPLVPEVVGRAPVVALLVALRTRGVADAEAAVERLLAAVPDTATRDPDLFLVTRGGRAATDVLDDVAAHLGVRHLHHLRDDEGVARDAERGLFPGVSRDAMRRCADEVVAALGGVGVVGSTGVGGLDATDGRRAGPGRGRRGRRSPVGAT